MKVFIVISALVSIASAGISPIVILPSTSALLRSPQLDSAVVQSERLGGNFAYTIAEGQSFQAVSPVLTSNIRTIDPLGVSYAINSLPILTTVNGQTIIIQPTSEQEQRAQQQQRDLIQQHQDQIQKRRDQIQEVVERQRHEEDQQLQEIQRRQEQIIQQQLQQQIAQQELVQQQQQDQQQQLLQLQQQLQQQQTLIGTIATTGTTGTVGTTSDDTVDTNDSIIVENAVLDRGDSVTGDKITDVEVSPDDTKADRLTENKSDDTITVEAN